MHVAFEKKKTRCKWPYAMCERDRWIRGVLEEAWAVLGSGVCMNVATSLITLATLTTLTTQQTGHKEP